MESTATNSLELAGDEKGGMEESVRDDRAAEEEATNEMKQLLPSKAAEDKVNCGGSAGVFGILPAELWMKILEELADSEDIQNVLWAYPELDKLFQSEKAACLFGLVLPHLISRQLVTELLGPEYVLMECKKLFKLRLVSKRWKRAVERSLETHAGRHPLSPRGQSWSSVGTLAENHFSYHRIRDYPLGASRFEQARDIDTFLKQMGDYQGNPFPAHSVHLQNSGDTDFGEPVAKLVVLLERFGEHVRDLEMENLGYRFGEAGDLELCRNILKCLTLAPNLSSLVLLGKSFRLGRRILDAFFGKPQNQDLFPVLPKLERFVWRVPFRAGSVWMSRMVERYGKSGGLRKLGIPLALLETLDLASFQPINLTELHIFLGSEFDGNVGRIGGVLKGLPNHQEIRKFGLSSLKPCKDGTTAVEMNGLIRMLAKLQFESVILQDLNVVEGKEWIGPALAQPPASAVSWLDLEDEWKRGWSFDFLKELPSLKFLSIHVDYNGTPNLFAENHRRMMSDDKLVVGDWGERLSLGEILRRYYMMAYDPSLEIAETGGIWSGVPSLEMLTVSMLGFDGHQNKYLGVRFVRECGNKAFFGPTPAKVVKRTARRVC